jgi:hypothetical protein
MRGGCAIVGEYRVGIGFRSGLRLGFWFWFRLGAGGGGVVVVRGVFIDGGERLEGGSDSRGAEEGGGGSGELTASVAVLRLHGWEYVIGCLMSGFIFPSVVCFSFVAVLF